MARMISFQVVFFTVLFLFTQWSLFLFIILFDFIVRAFRRSEFSLFSLTGKWLLSTLDATPHYTDEAPKRFALYLGLGTVLSALLLYSLGFVKTSMGVASILFFCAFLEAAFDFCIGCRIYYALNLVKGKAKITYDRYFN